MATETFYRAATVSSNAAIVALAKKGEVVSFVKKAATAQEAKYAKVETGAQIFAAEVKLAEFPPTDDSGGEDQGSGSAPSDEGGESDSGDEGKDDSAPDFTKDEGSSESGDEGGEPKKEKKLPPAEETNVLLKQLIDLVGGGGGLGAPGDDAGAGLDAAGGLPDVGAPVPGAPEGGLGAGPAGPGGPLPPPIKEKSPIGAGAFAHYDPSEAEITAITVSSDKTAAILAEAEKVYPTHTVAKIRRTGKATLNGKVYDLPTNKLAVVTLVKK